LCDQAPDWLVLMNALSTTASSSFVERHHAEIRDVCFAGVALAHMLLSTAFELGIPMRQHDDGNVVIDIHGQPDVPVTDLKSIVQHLMLRGMSQVDISREIATIYENEANDAITLDLGLDEDGKRWHTTLGQLRLAARVGPFFTLDDLPTMSSELVADSMAFASNNGLVLSSTSLHVLWQSATPYIMNAASKMLNDQMLYRHVRDSNIVSTVVGGAQAGYYIFTMRDYIQQYCWNRLPFAFALLLIPTTFNVKNFMVKTNMELTGMMVVSAARGITNVAALHYTDLYFSSVLYNVTASYDATFLVYLAAFIAGFAPFRKSLPMQALPSAAKNLVRHIRANKRQLNTIYRSVIDVTTTAAVALSSSSSSLFGGSSAIDVDASIVVLLSMSSF